MIHQVVLFAIEGLKFEGITMRSSHLTVFLVGVLSAASGVMAEPQTDKVKKAVSVVETVTVTSSKPMYDGSYFASKVTFEDACNMTKTVTYFDKNGDIEKVSNTAFDVSKIDPAKVALDPWGGAKFWSYNEQPVFTCSTRKAVILAPRFQVITSVSQI